jgi:hypothetical protein
VIQIKDGCSIILRETKVCFEQSGREDVIIDAATFGKVEGKLKEVYGLC